MLIAESPTQFHDKEWKLVLEKITVPSSIVCVPRPRLHALLEQSVLSCTSTIITGRAGSGKTTLPTDFAEKSGRNVAWYKVDAPESNLQIFFQYLISSIGFQRPGFGGYSLLPLLRAAPGRHQIHYWLNTSFLSWSAQCCAIIDCHRRSSSGVRCRLGCDVLSPTAAFVTVRRSLVDY